MTQGRSIKWAILLVNAFVVMNVNEAFACAKVSADQAINCHEMKVSFDLSACKENSPSAAQLKCDSHKGEAVVKTSTHAYMISLRKIEEGQYRDNWVLDGNVQRIVIKRPGSRSVAVTPPVEVVIPPAPSVTSAPALFNFKGALRLRGEKADKTDYASDRGFTLLRVRTEFGFTPRSDTSVFIQPQFTKAFGEKTFNGKSNTENNLTQTSGGTYDNSVSLHQGYVRYALFENLYLQAGLQVLSYGDELLVGALEWNNVGRSFDAFKIKHSYSAGSLDLFSAKLVDNNTTGQGDGDKDFHGVHHTVNLGEYLKAFDMYSFYLRDSSVVPRPDEVLSAGTRLKSDIGGLDYRMEYTRQWISVASKVPRPGRRMLKLVILFKVLQKSGWDWKDL